MLTLENIRMHDRQIQDTNNKFFPKINKLVDLANKRLAQQYPNKVYGTSTNFTGSFSIFDALYDLQSFNQLPQIKNPSCIESQETMSQEAHANALAPIMTQDQFRDALLIKML